MLSIKPMSKLSTHPNLPVRGGKRGDEEEKKKKDESLAEQLTLNSFTRHGYNIEHIRGGICGPLPGECKIC